MKHQKILLCSLDRRPPAKRSWTSSTGSESTHSPGKRDPPRSWAGLLEWHCHWQVALLDWAARLKASCYYSVGSTRATAHTSFAGRAGIPCQCTRVPVSRHVCLTIARACYALSPGLNGQVMIYILRNRAHHDNVFYHQCLKPDSLAHCAGKSTVVLRFCGVRRGCSVPSVARRSVPMLPFRPVSVMTQAGVYTAIQSNDCHWAAIMITCMGLARRRPHRHCNTRAHAVILLPDQEVSWGRSWCTHMGVRSGRGNGQTSASALQKQMRTLCINKSST